MIEKVNVAIFASGRGSNAQSLVQQSKNPDARYTVKTILSNRINAGVLDFAKANRIACKTFNRDELYHSETILKYLKDQDIDLLVLAGFLWLIPEYLINAFPRRILNIHPAILPKYGGAGMYGANVHKAVKENGDKVSGITIHFADEQYDKGSIIFQTRCQLDPNDTFDKIAERVLRLEHHFYPLVVNGVATRLSNMR